MTAPNLATIGTITGATDLASLTTSLSAVTANAAGSSKVYKINSIYVSNVTSASSDVTVDILRSAVGFNLAKAITVPAKASQIISGKDTAFYLTEGDTIRGMSSVNAALNILVSYEIMG